MEGWIKIHRKILDWEWYEDANILGLWIHLLLKANWEDKKWKGIVIPRGSLVTSRQHLAEETNLSEQQIRKILKLLENNQQITIKTTNKYTLISIVKYNIYQLNENENNQQNNQQINQQITNKEPQLKNNKNIFNYFISNYIVKLDGKDFGEKIKIKGQMRRDPKWIELNDVEQMDLIGR